MTSMEAMEQFDRLVVAGFFVPRDSEGSTDAAFTEWRTLLSGYSAEDVSDGLTALLRAKTDRNWPTIGQIRGAIASVTSGRESKGCANCGGSGWVDAPPYRANGAHVYVGVTRCPACGKPAPKREGPSHQTPLSGDELRAWQAAQRPVEVITSRAEMMARLRAYAERARGPRVISKPSWHHPDEREADAVHG